MEDFGRGMPVDWNNGEGRYNCELLFCEMYAGGKYGAGEDNYEFSLGLNGLGPVSYTHLDVYKRQGQQRRNEDGLNAGGVSRNADALEVLRGGDTAVSYTHL